VDHLGIRHQFFNLGLLKFGDFIDIEIGKSLFDSGPFLIEGLPVETRHKNRATHSLEIVVVIFQLFHLLMLHPPL
jgi:hypothetical protein